MNRDVVVPYKFLGCSIDDCELFNYPRRTEGFLALCSENKDERETFHSLLVNTSKFDPADA